ncbi:MAG: 50S ribosomal protein L18 [Candidatus Firestonebacteria bacterium]|nr:50S ribosomal protein L18 [Candidatus Firestonebacteria bacterium]
MRVYTSRNAERQNRHVRLRRKVEGSTERPRLHVFKSHKNFYIQVIDDLAGTTLVAASSLEPEMKSSIKSRGNVEAAKKMGGVIAERLLAKGIKQVVFDRGGYQYQGAVKALADAARAAGLEF